MFKLRLLFGYTVVLLCVLYSGCQVSDECKAFSDLSRDQQRVEFKTFTAEKQLDIYLCVMKEKPPDLSFAQYIADRGEEALPLVVTKMKTVKKEIDQEDLIYILELMSADDHLRGRKDIITQISQIIDEMKIDSVRERSLERLKKIEINSGIKPFTYVE